MRKKAKVEVEIGALAMLVLEFLHAQKREIACRLRIIALARNRLGSSSDPEAKSLLASFDFAVDKKWSTTRIIKEFKDRLKLFGAWDETSERVWNLFHPLNDGLQKMIRSGVEDNQLWLDWLCSVKGVGLLLAGEVIGVFAKALKPGETFGQHFRTTSQMWAFVGLDVQEGRAPSLTPGKPASFNRQFRSILVTRLGTSLIRTGGGYYEHYKAQKERLERRFARDGIKIVPSGQLPTKGGKKYEPEGVISTGHLDNMARRKMVKLFISHLWEEIRRAEGLSAGEAYVFTGEHTHSRDHYIAPIRDKSQKKAKPK
jgi:hypothetical protein